MLQLRPRTCTNPLYAAIGSILLAPVATLACGASKYTPDDFGAADPITLTVDVDVVAEGQARLGSAAWVGRVPSLVADGSGLYWYDVEGNVFARRRGESGVVRLLAGVGSTSGSMTLGGGTPVVMSLTAGADHLYVAEAHVTHTSDSTDADPPTRLLSIPKDGGPPSVLLESESEVLVAIAVDGDRLLVGGYGVDAMLPRYQVSLANPALEELSPEAARESVAGAAEGQLSLWQSRRRYTYEFWVCPGYFLARYFGASIDVLFFLDAESGRERTFTLLGSHVPSLVCDQQHVYFYSSGGFADIVDEQQLVRVDVQSGQLARLISPDLNLQSNFSVLAEDAESVYVNNGDAILAIRKP
jgi:hypothetical protein